MYSGNVSREAVPRIGLQAGRIVAFDFVEHARREVCRADDVILVLLDDKPDADPFAANSFACYSMSRDHNPCASRVCRRKPPRYKP
jgi:hypothetical protein